MMQPSSDGVDMKMMNQSSIYTMDLVNGAHLGGQPAFPGQPYGGNKITLEQVDPSTFEDDDSDEDGPKFKTGKKTKGRVKIKMEFIENKLRRYTTFSKRKTGIMKKAYELSTLTGTQVMLLVASETGHVYTFATRKLQPMITSESGKALIQTCLNSPDPPPMAPGQQQAVEQRMNPTGFEETELTYAVEEESGKLILDNNTSGLKPVYTLSSSNGTDDVSNFIQTHQSPTPHPPSATQNHSLQGPGVPMRQVTVAAPPQSAVSTMSMSMPPLLQQQPQFTTTAIPASSTKPATSGTNSISLQLPGLPPGFILPQGMSFTIPVQSSTPQQASQTTSQPQTLVQIPTPQQMLTGAQVVPSSTGATTSVPQPVSLFAAATPQSAITPSVFMYQTPQGIMYAPATGSIQDKHIFNFQQPATALSLPQQGDTAGGQQIITIPVPVSLASQVLQIAPADTGPGVPMRQVTVAAPPQSAVSTMSMSMPPLLQQQPQFTTTAIPASSTKPATSGTNSISLQLPGLPPGFILPQGMSFTIPVQSSTPQQASQTTSQPQTLVQIPTPQQMLTGAQVVPSSTGATTSVPQPVSLFAAATPQSAITPSVFMYQTPQGIMYAPATGSIQDKHIFNFQQPATALSLPQQGDTAGGQQIITIPVPVSLASQVLQIAPADTGQLTDLSMSSAAKKPRK